MILRHTWLKVLAGWGVVMLTTGIASASVISANFSGDGPYDLAVNDAAGVVPADHWTNLSGATPSVADLMDDAGLATTMDMVLSNQGQATGGMAGLVSPDNNAQMLRGWVALDGSAFSVALNQIPYSLYDLYVYLGNNDGGFEGSDCKVTVGAAEVFGQCPAAMTDTPSFVQITGTSTGDANPGNYAKFSNLTDSSLTLTLGGVGNKSSIAGFQVVEVVPEPSSIILLGLGGLGLIKKRRKH